MPGRPSPAGQMVPNGFSATLWNRERNATLGILWLRSAIAIDQLALSGIFEGGVIHGLRRGGGTMGRVDIQTVAVRIFLEHCLDPLGELVGVLPHVLRGDGVQRLIVRKRVTAFAAILVVRIDLGVTTIPCRNGPTGITGALGAHR